MSLSLAALDVDLMQIGYEPTSVKGAQTNYRLGDVASKIFHPLMVVKRLQHNYNHCYMDYVGRAESKNTQK
jgi:p-aminobenzoyl-glutamate transporter AbgT